VDEFLLFVSVVAPLTEPLLLVDFFNFLLALERELASESVSDSLLMPKEGL